MISPPCPFPLKTPGIRQKGGRSQYRVTFRALASVAVRLSVHVAPVKSTFQLLNESTLTI